MEKENLPIRIAFEYLKSKGIVHTQKDVSLKLNIATSNLSKAFNGDSEYLTRGFVEKFNKYFNSIFNEDWLLTGEGDMLKTKSEITPKAEGDYMMVEYVDLRASAGRLGGADIDLLPETHIRLVPKEYKNGGFLVVRVDGDSMDDGTKRSLCDGDEVLIKEKKDFQVKDLPIKKTVFVITSREGNVLKQIKEINTEEGYIICHSFNPIYPDFKMELSDIYQIFIVCKVVARQISLI